VVLQVIPSHGEGWGRPHLEAMSCGRPVLATNWSGPTAFMRHGDTGYLIDVEDQLVPAE
jgi:glycosyltransferase involved in cell wall biosynthesis